MPMKWLNKKIDWLYENILVWIVFTFIINIIYAKKFNLNLYKICKQQIRELLLYSSLYGSLSIKFSIMYLVQFLNLEINFEATQKNYERITLIDWIYSTKYECIIYSFYLICIFIRIFIYPSYSIY